MPVQQQLFCEEHGVNYINGKFGPFHKTDEGLTCKPLGNGGYSAKPSAPSNHGGEEGKPQAIRKMFDAKSAGIIKSVALQESVKLISALEPKADLAKALGGVASSYVYFLKLLQNGTNDTTTENNQA